MVTLFSSPLTFLSQRKLLREVKKKKKGEEKKRNDLQLDIINNFIISRKHHVQGSSWGWSHFITGDVANLECQDINARH